MRGEGAGGCGGAADLSSHSSRSLGWKAALMRADGAWSARGDAKFPDGVNYSAHLSNFSARRRSVRVAQAI